MFTATPVPTASGQTTANAKQLSSATVPPLDVDIALTGVKSMGAAFGRPGITYDTDFPWIHMKRSSVLFTELDRRLSLSNNNQNKRKYKEENKKCRKNRQREKQRDFDKVNNKMKCV